MMIVGVLDTTPCHSDLEAVRGRVDWVAPSSLIKRGAIDLAYLAACVAGQC